MNKLFGNTKMTWPKVIIFALIIGIYVGIIMDVNFLYGTSFQDIGIQYEWWVLFAIVIVVNCKKNYEAALKCFLFFLISQPTIFATEAIIGHISWEKAYYYYFGNWFWTSLLTLPGGFIAYYCKKDNVIGDIILGIGNFIEVLFSMYYISQCIQNFPKHLLSAIFCLFVVVITNLYIKKTKKDRIISIITTLVLYAIIAVYCLVTGRIIF